MKERYNNISWGWMRKNWNLLWIMIVMRRIYLSGEVLSLDRGKENSRW